MAVSEKRDLLIGKQKVLVRVPLRKDVIVFVGDGAVDELSLFIDLERSERKICQILAIGIRQHRPGPIDCESRIRIELVRLIETGRNPIMISADRDGVQRPYSV